MEKLKVFFNTTNLEKKLTFFFGFCISSIGTIKIQVPLLNYPLYVWFTFFFTFFLIIQLIIKKNFFFLLSNFNNKYFFFIIFFFILLFLLTLNLGVEYSRLKPIIIFTLFYFILQNTNKKDKDNGVKLLILGLIFGAIFNCFVAFLQKVGFEPINNLRYFLIIEKLKPNDFTDGGYWQRHPPGFSVTSVQFSYILSSLNIITLYYLFFEKFFKKNNSLKFFFIYFVFFSYSLITFSKYMIVTNLLFFIFFYFWKNKVNLKKIIFLLVLILIFIFINMKNINNFYTKINEAFYDRKLLIKTSVLFLEKFPYGLKMEEVIKEKEIIVENNFTIIRDKNYILTTAPHNFILTSSYYLGYSVFFIQIFFVIFIVLFGFKSIFLNNKNRFLKSLYLAMLNNFGYGMFHNSGIFNGDFFIILILTIIISELNFIKTYKND